MVVAATSAETDAMLRRLLDDSEIRAVLARYARGCDRNDMDLVRSCYADATDAHGHVNGSLPIRLKRRERWRTAA